MLKTVKYPDSYVVWDLETTGLDQNKCDVIEIGAMKVENGVVVEEKNWLLNHGKDIPDFIVDITGISTELINKEGVPPADAMREAIAFFNFSDKNCPNLTHNGIKFDIGFFVSQACKTLSYN